MITMTGAHEAYLRGDMWMPCVFSLGQNGLLVDAGVGHLTAIICNYRSAIIRFEGV
jgi:hypothetical protein